jgi:hypothetical protein
VQRRLGPMSGQKSGLVVAVFGTVLDVQRELLWLRPWLPTALNVPTPRADEVHWMVYGRDELPDLFPDVSVMLGDAKRLPQASPPDLSATRIWVQTPGSKGIDAGDGVYHVLLWLIRPPTTNKSGAVEIEITAGHRLMTARRAAALALAAANPAADLWPAILRLNDHNPATPLIAGNLGGAAAGISSAACGAGGVDGGAGPSGVGGDVGEYAGSEEVTVWMREQPALVGQAMLDERQSKLDSAVRAGVHALRVRHLQLSWARNEAACLKGARAWRRIGGLSAEERARLLLWRVVGPLNVEPDAAVYIDEKGSKHLKSPPHAPSSAPAGLQRLAVYELLESWLAERGEQMAQCRKWAQSLAWRFLDDWGSDERWLSLVIAAHSPGTPYTDGHPERHVKGVFAVARTDAERECAEAHLGQISLMARFELGSSKPTVVNSVVTAVQTAAGLEGWSLVLDGSAVPGPMFLRDWSALRELLPRLKFDLVRIGFPLPAFETVAALHDTSPKRLAPLNANSPGLGLGGMSAFCLSQAAAKKLVAAFQTSSRPNIESLALSMHSLTFTTPSVFALAM